MEGMHLTSHSNLRDKKMMTLRHRLGHIGQGNIFIFYKSFCNDMLVQVPYIYVADVSTEHQNYSYTNKLSVKCKS